MLLCSFSGAEFGEPAPPLAAARDSLVGALGQQNGHVAGEWPATN